MSLKTRTALEIAAVFAVATFAAGCALTRSDVKSLRDCDASRIPLDTRIKTTIAALNAIPAHCGPSRNRRVRDEELRVYEVVGRIARAKRERDHDIHIVLEDPDSPHARLVVEAADPGMWANEKSPYRDRLAAGRHMLDALVSGAPGDRLDNLRGMVVRVTGVGFFDVNHLQMGRSRSCIELHPVLTIERVNTPSPESLATARLDSSPRSSHSWRSTPHGLAARAALIGLFTLRHVGLGPHVHPTLPSAVDATQIAQLWTEPTDFEARNLFNGPWGSQAAPKPDDVYSFVAEKKAGFSPGYDVKSPDGTEWSIKMGPEAQTEVVASRLLWATGFHQPPVYYLPRWMLGRGSSTDVQGPARFRPKISALSSKGPWSWQQNPFVATQAYRGLVVLMMILNSTDLKNDNNIVYELAEQREGAERWYVVRDLGATFGETGLYRPRRNYLEGFEKQTFIKGVEHGNVRFEFHGLQQELVRHIRPADVRWMCELLARLSISQWHDAFRAGGYSMDVADRFIAKLREKIEAGKRL